MNLEAIRSGDSILLDANIIVYAVQRASEECKRLLIRCATNEITGVLPLHILAEVMHVLMLAEARDSGWIRGQNLARRLAKLPDRIKSLNRYETPIRDLLAIGLLLEPVQREDILVAMGLAREAGILTNDALLAAVGRRLRIPAIASADRHFERIKGLTLFSPDDLRLDS